MSRKYPMAFVVEPGKIDFQDYLLPELGEDEVQVNVKVVSLCGSDLHIFKGLHPSARLPVPVGHEISGQVEAVGASVRSVRPGDRVTIEPVITCGHCYFCQRGQHHLCSNISFLYRQGHGGLTPHLVVKEKWTHILPDNLSFAEGSLIEPAAVALHAVRNSRIDSGESSAIFGGGPIGLLILQILRASAAGEIFVVDIQNARLEAARKFGADQVFNNLDLDSVHEIMNHTSGLGVDRSFEAVGIQLTLVQALQALKKGGTAVLVGLFEIPEACIPANLFIQKEITLSGTQAYFWDFQRVLQLCSRGKLDLKGMITHEFPLSQAQLAFETLLNPDSGAVKVAVNVNGG